MAFRTLDDLDVKGKRVLVRADLNVPVKDGVVTDATRIARQAPTIKELADKGAKVIVLSHFVRRSKRLNSPRKKSKPLFWQSNRKPLPKPSALRMSARQKMPPKPQEPPPRKPRPRRKPPMFNIKKMSIIKPLPL